MMSRRARWEVLRAVYPRYRSAARVERGRILDEFCEATGYQRTYAMRLLNGPPPGVGRRLEGRPATDRLEFDLYHSASHLTRWS
jgi:hypothetical protein